MADNLLGDSAASLTEITQLVSSGVLLVDDEGRRVWADEAAADMFGLDTATGRSSGQMPDMYTADGEWLPPKARPYMTVFDTGEPMRELRCQATLADGRGHVAVDAVPITGEADVSYVALSVETADPEEHDRPDQGVEGLEEDVSDVFERVDEAFIALDEDECFTYVNEQAETILDRRAEELLGRHVCEAFPEAEDSVFQEQYERAVETQEPVTFEAKYPPLDTWFEVTAYPSESGLSVYFEDVTERKARERELEQYEAIFESIDDGVYVVDESGCFAMVNDAYTELTGYAREELIGEPTSKVVSDAVVEQATEIRDRLAAGDVDQARLEAEVERADGGRIEAEATFALLEGSDGTTRRIAVVRDVTERKARERELEESRARYQTLIDNFPNGAVALFDEDIRYELIGGDAPTSIDAELGELEGNRPDEVYPKSLASQLLPHFRATVDGERRSFLVRHGNEVRKVRTVPIRDADGAVRSGLAISQDVTRRRERERKLQEQRERAGVLSAINSLVQDVSESVVRQSDPEAIRSVVRERLRESEFYESAWVGEVGPERETIRQALGATADVPADPPLDIDDDSDSAAPTVRAVRRSEMQVVTPHSDDEQTAATGDFAGMAAIPLTFEQSMYGVLTVYTDREDVFRDAERQALDRLGTIVAHAVQARSRESQLRHSERLYRTLMENVPNGVVAMVDTDLRYEALAGELVDELAVDPDELRGKRPTEVDVIDAETGERLESAFRTALSGESVSLEFEFRDRVLERRVHPIWDESGRRVVNAMALSQDVTERVEHERQLERERERLEFLVRLVRHNLLNSLNLVTARLEMIEGRVDYEVAQHLDTAQRRAGKMKDLVETIRGLTSAVVAGEAHELDPVSLDDVLARQVESAAVSYPEADFELVSNPPVDILADDLLQEALENLLDNAVQHNDKATPEVTVDVSTTRETATVSIADNGPGMPDHLEESIFEQGPQSFEDPGTGFGLHIVREVVDAYDGTISVGDNDPEGAVFELTFPRQDT